jgi:4'-phosphopantetheinyl transferase
VIAVGEVLIVLARPETLHGDAARALLAPDELARLDRFHFERDRVVALASRALQRRALSAAVDGAIRPAAWRFELDASGRPQIASPATPLSWNVANTIGLVGCAVTVGRAIGLDVEPRRDDAPADIVDSHFAPAERAALRALAAGEQPRRFVELWTLKEAYLKARSVGLSAPLDTFAVDPSTTPPGLAIDDVVGDRADRWDLTQWWIDGAHCVAVCVERGARITVRWERG